MDECFLIFTSLIVGYVMGIISLIIGSGLTSRAMKGKGMLPEIFEPKGDVFTVETPDDMAPFPDDVKNEAEEHVLKKTNKFLETLGVRAEGK